MKLKAQIMDEAAMNRALMRISHEIAEKNTLGEGMATHSSILAWRIPMDRRAWQAAVHGVAKSQTLLSN